MRRISILLAAVAIPASAMGQDAPPTSIPEAPPASADVDASFNYDDGSGSVTVVDYGGGNQDIARAARDGHAIKLSGVAGRRRGRLGSVPEYHRVVKGDTLWDLSRHYFANPWNWPRVWSYNPEVTNPNWIYPGDRLRLLPPGDVSIPASARGRGFRGAGGRARAGTLFLRSRGFVDREVLETSGTIVGSREEVQMLAEQDEVYIEFDEDDDVRVGQEYTVFRADESVGGVRGGRRNLGRLVEIYGAARVVSYDPETSIARGVITESLNPIERGYRVGPMSRRHEVVPPVQNEVDLEGYIVATVDPAQVLGEYYVVFIDRGSDDGLVEGNRGFVLRQRDMWRESRDERDDRSGYPHEIVAEFRIVEVRARTSTCLITRSTTDIRIGDRFEMRRGY